MRRATTARPLLFALLVVMLLGAGASISRAARPALSADTAAPPPSCQNETASGPFGQPIQITLDCTDATAQQLTYAIVNNPSHGALGPIDQATGQLTYYPGSDYYGGDGFTFEASSANGTSATYSVAITVAPPPPGCEAIVATTPVNTPVTIQFACAALAGTPLAYTIDSSPSHGTLGPITQSGGEVVYTPIAGYTGRDRFTYSAASAYGTAPPVAVSITVEKPPPKCTVPKLAGKTLARATKLLAAAHCAVGKVTQPRHSHGKLVVGSSKPGAGAKRGAGATVAIRLVAAKTVSAARRRTRRPRAARPAHRAAAPRARG